MPEKQQHAPFESDAESRLRALLANHALGIVEVTTDGRIALANRALGDWLGIEPSMLLDRELADLLHPEDRLTLARQLDRLADATIDSTTIAHRLQRPAGVPLWVRSTWSARRSASGSITHLIAIVENIAQQREDELVRSILEESIRGLEERRRFIDQMIGGLPVIAWRALPSGICEYVSPQWCAVTGIRDGSGLRWLAAIHPEDRASFLAAWSHNTPLTGDPKRVPCRLRRGDGSYVRYEAIAAAIRDDAGEIQAWSGVLLAARVLTRLAREVPVDGLASDRLAIEMPPVGEIPLRVLPNRRPEPPAGSGYRPS